MIEEKQCDKCGEVKPVDYFYRHTNMASGRLNTCKNCRSAYSLKRHHERMSDPAYKEHRKTLYRNRGQKKQYGKSAYSQKWTRQNPIKAKAQRIVAKAIRVGELLRKPCEVCGVLKTHAHHCDYTKPLEVLFLCPTHHRAWHRVFEVEG